MLSAFIRRGQTRRSAPIGWMDVVVGRHAGLPLPEGWTGRHGESVVTREAVPANGVQHVIARFLAPSQTLPRENDHRGGNSHGARIPVPAGTL